MTTVILSAADPAHPSLSELETLVEAWLRDLAYHWNSPEPPGETALAEVGLLERLEGGTTVSEDVARAGPPLP